MRGVASARHSGEDGWNGMDDPQDPIAAAQRRSSQRVRQAQVGDAVRGAGWHHRPRTRALVKRVRNTHEPLFFQKQPERIPPRTKRAAVKPDPENLNVLSPFDKLLLSHELWDIRPRSPPERSKRDVRRSGSPGQCSFLSFCMASLASFVNIITVLSYATCRHILHKFVNFSRKDWP